MKSVVAGTAGHIDHGKTALVKALTGIDADRLEEEKRRGITIDLGFAHLELAAAGGQPVRLAFVDVPGHERFVRNMLAGVGGIDLVILVIAADESIKPQTREHFDICRLLNLQRGITVLTKSDLVDEQTLDVVRMEVEDFLRGSFLDSSQSPIIPVSSRTGAGLEILRRELAKTACEVQTRDASSLPRVPIDRVFTMKGFGTVATGTLIAGTIGKDDELEAFPTGKRIRVRGIQVHSAPADQVTAGHRTALNLAAVSKDDLQRGFTLAACDIFREARRIDVSLAMLASARPLKHGARVHFHAHTAESVATVALFSRKTIAPNEVSFAQLRLAGPMLLLPGDRFIIRQFSPVVTIGGGVVLDACPITRKPQADFLKVLAQGDAGSILAVRISRRGTRGLTLSDAVAETGIRREEIGRMAARLEQAGRIVIVAESYFSAEAFQRLANEVLAALQRFHSANPLAGGINREALREQLRSRPELFGAVLDSLVAEGKIHGPGELVRLAAHGVTMKDEETESRAAIENAFRTAGLTVPALDQVLGGLKVDRVRARKLVTLLLREKILVKISDGLVFHREALEELRKRIVAQKSVSARIGVAAFKDMTGVSRKYAIPLLEYLDREHVTKRVGDERVIL